MTKPSRPGGSRTLRAALYERVSSEEQVEGYSLDAQDRAGRLYCEAQGWEVIDVYRDEGKSARTDDLSKRPAFQQLLADAEAGLFDVIVVHKLDRFSRNLRLTLETLDRLEKANVGFVSINENMDFATPMGRVVLSTMGSLAQFYSDNLASETKKGKAERKAQGLYNGLLPFGLKKSGQGIPIPDPDTYPGLLLAFRLAAEGTSDREVAEALNAAGYRTTGNRGPNLFTKDTVCRMLKNRFYLGELPDGKGGWMPGVHEQVLDEELFERAQLAREANMTNAAKVNRRHRRYSLSGLAVCGLCGGRLHFHTQREGRARVYCYQGRQVKKCTQRSTFLDGIDAQIGTYLGTFHLPDDLVAQVIALSERARDERDDTEIRRREIEGRLERNKNLYKWGDMTEEAYVTERDRLHAELSTLRSTSDRASLYHPSSGVSAGSAGRLGYRNTRAAEHPSAAHLPDGRDRG
jgi:DNA invertase Pin-like site-specific DNA recombinase